MSHLAEFIQNHVLYVATVAFLAVFATTLEIRHRVRGAVALSPQQAVQIINGGALVVDVRPAEAYSAGHIIDARNIPEAEVTAQATDSLKKYREKPLLLYCDTGSASAAAARLLKSLGFVKAVNLQGGLAAWKQENLPVVSGAGKSGAKKGGK